MSISTADLARHNRVLLAVISGIICLAAIFTLWFGNVSLAYSISHSEWVLSNRNLLRTVSEFGKNGFYVFFAGVLVYGLMSRRNELVRIPLAYLMGQFLGSIVLVRLLKMLTGHARPQEIFAASGPFHDTWIGPTLESAFHGFPSGHTTDLFISVIFASFLVKKLPLKLIIISFAVFMGFTRIALAKHFPYDVLAGAVIGTAVSFLVGRFWLFPRLEHAGVNTANKPIRYGQQ